MSSIESLLERNLGPVRAPGALWDRISDAPKPVRRTDRRTDRRLIWATAAAMVVAGLWSLERSEDIRSNDPAAIRAWVKSRTGMEIPLVEGCATVGAWTRRGKVEVAYRAGGREGALAVEKTAGPDRPEHWNRASYAGKDAISWTQGGQAYTLACVFPGELEAGCKLCHAGGVFN